MSYPSYICIVITVHSDHITASASTRILSAIDDNISHCRKQIEKLEEWEKGLLLGMFV